MKKVILIIIFFFTNVGLINASTEGRLFVEALPTTYEGNNISIELNKIYKNEIEPENIYKAQLHTYTHRHEYLDITENLKMKVGNRKEYLYLNIEQDFCVQDCRPNEYPYLKLHYIFNDPPEIKLIKPSDNYITQQTEIGFHWEGLDYDGKLLEYSLRIGKKNGGDIVFESGWITQTEHKINLEAGKYFWEVIVRDNSKLDNIITSDTFNFEIIEYITQTEEVESSLEDPEFEFLTKRNRLLVDIKNDDYHQARIYVNDALAITTLKTNLPIELIENIKEGIEYKISVVLEDEMGNQSKKISQTYFRPNSEAGTVLGLEHTKTSKTPPINICRYSYNETYQYFTNVDCDFHPPKLIALNHITDEKGELYEKTLYGTYNPYLKIIVDVYRCTLPFICMPTKIDSYFKIKKPYSDVRIEIDQKYTPIHKYEERPGYTFLTLTLSEENLSGQDITAKVFFNQSVFFKTAFDSIERLTPWSEPIRIHTPFQIKRLSPTKMFRFPFNKNIGVTQWHGYTAYQSPHTGVDFGSYREPIYAPADGRIHNIGWDDYYGSCLSGGRFITIFHDNEMYTVYFHLENTTRENGRSWRRGDRVYEGDLLGISGNTGAFNCQPLGYHLHFELRKTFHQNSHIDPVPHIDINWNNIPTLGYQQYPGRLTGNNPHPTW